jgi:feruloyl esterase
MRASILSAAVMSAGLIASARLSAQPPQDPAPPEPMSCSSLAGLKITQTKITSAETVAAGAFQAPGPAGPGRPAADFSRLPAFCRVRGSIMPSSDSDIRFELWLPAENWNGKFLQTGNGGAGGSIVYDSLADPLMRGYAVANTDMGHQGAGGDFSWAVGHPQKLIDYQYRATHELTVVGKLITFQRYGTGADKSYWDGCSSGGRQGLKEAQRYPGDYDAIIAGAPASNWSPLMALSITIQKNLGPEGLRPDRLGLLNQAAIAACDTDDGVEDGVISDYASCDFDPARLECASGQTGQCLTTTDVAAAQRVYAGVVGADGNEIMPGTGPGGEMLWAAYALPAFEFSIGTSYFRNVIVDDPDWDPATFDADRDTALAERVDRGAATAMDPNLYDFIAGGGKLITYHGTADGLIPYRNSVNYYESVVDTLGQDAVDASVRLYLVPGMGHCSGGNGAFAVDWLSALEDWDETGEAPDALLGTHPAGGPPNPAFPSASSAPFTRPICPYPDVAAYKGRGDENDAASFECVAP